MKTWVFLVLLLWGLLLPGVVNGNDHPRSLNLSLFYPVSTNGSKEVATRVNISLLYGNVGRVTSFDLSGLVSVINRDFSGFQFSGLVGIVKGDGSGLRISGLVNWTGGRFGGWQFGGFNHAGILQGAQIGILNTTDSVKSGFQVGFINVAKKQNGVPFGLINIAENGKLQLLLYGTTYSNLNLGVRFLANQYYSELAIGQTNLEFWTEQSTTLSFHYGYMMPLTEEDEYQFSIDAGYIHVANNPEFYKPNPEEDFFALQLRLLLHIKLTSEISAFGGGGTTLTFENYAIPADKYFRVLFLAGISFY